MQFVLADTYRYWWPITVRLPDPDKPGQIAVQRLSVQFAAADRDREIEEWSRYEKMESPAARAQHEADQLRRLCHDWQDVVDEGGAPIPFTPGNFDAALKRAWFRDALHRGLRESLSGEEVRLGN